MHAIMETLLLYQDVFFAMPKRPRWHENKKSVGIRPQAVLAPQRFLKPSDFSVQIYAEAENNANELARLALPRRHWVCGEAEYP